MDNLQEDPEALEEVTPMSNQLNIAPQVTLAIVLTCVTIVSLATTILVHVLHSRYRRNQEKSYLASRDTSKRCTDEEKLVVALNPPNPGLTAAKLGVDGGQGKKNWSLHAGDNGAIPQECQNVTSVPKTVLKIQYFSSPRYSVASVSDVSCYSDDVSTIVGKEGSKTMEPHKEMEQDMEGLYDDYYDNGRNSNYSRQHLTLPELRPTSAFSLSGLLDMYMGSPSLGGMGSPVDPYRESCTAKGWPANGLHGRGQHLQPSISPVATWSSRFSMSVSPHGPSPLQSRSPHFFPPPLLSRGKLLAKPRVQQPTSSQLGYARALPTNADQASRLHHLMPKQEGGVRRRQRGESLLGEVSRMGKSSKP